MSLHSVVPPPPPPIYFLHIEKTGGTSLTNAIAAWFPASDVFCNEGSISSAFLTSIEPELTREILIAGHAQNGVAKRLMGRARVVTLLRDPEGQAVSHYFHARLDVRHVHHRDARQLSFRDYIIKHPRYVIFQLWALAMAMSDDYYEDIDRTVRTLPAIQRLLWDFDCVGVLERRAEFCACFSAKVLNGRPVTLPHLNSALSRGAEDREIALARSQYRALAATPVIGKLIEVERRLYDEAKAVADHHTRSLPRAAPLASATPDPMYLHPDRFQRRAGVLDGGIRCPLAGVNGHLIYGPYIPVPAGRHEADFRFAILGEALGPKARLTLEVVAGDRILARRALKRSELYRSQARRLSFAPATTVDAIEFRLGADGFEGGQLRFDGVALRLARPSPSPTHLPEWVKIWAAPPRQTARPSPIANGSPSWWSRGESNP